MVNPTIKGQTKRIRIFAKFYNEKGEVVLDTYKMVKAKIVALIEGTPATEWYIKVVYGKDLWNDGRYKDKKTVLKVLSDWTSKDMIKTSQETF